MQLTEEPGNTLNLWPEILFSLGTKGLYLLSLWFVSCRLWLFNCTLSCHTSDMTSRAGAKYGSTSARLVQILTTASWNVHRESLKQCARHKIININIQMSATLKFIHTLSFKLYASIFWLTNHRALLYKLQKTYPGIYLLRSIFTK